ncbi:hypothetical protein EW146_g5810 [Bondarzewia mesenterica]|uniref:VWFA domain-containing protein n=1 Tax=Bondarzewia mesenterica TaxID=1095465 RepID=A0A4S4LQF1_9AGAM|nr:hypothetical protein EW146_g5810 [Bondarzewia mesenterica]
MASYTLHNPHVKLTYKEWLRQAEINSAEAKTMLVKGGRIPSNAVVWGDENGRPAYICRSFYEGKMHVGKAVHGVGAVILYNGLKGIKVDEYEVLVASSTSRWTFDSTEVVTTTVVNSFDLRRLWSIFNLKTVVIVDDSTSMVEEGLWPDAREALAGVAEISGEYNTDGLDLYFLNDTTCRMNLKDRTAVLDLFNSIQPEGQTPTGKKLQEVLDKYIVLLENKEFNHKPINIIVITDGDPTDDPVEVIVNAARRLEHSGVALRKLGIQFVQIGSDPLATEALKALDNDLEHQYQIRDIVDATVYDPKDPRFQQEKLLKILMGAIDHAVDQGRPPLRV